MIRAQSLSYTFASGRCGLAGVDLEAAPGELIALVGPNGSGKTTLLRLLAGDLLPTAGTLTVDTTRIGWAPAEAVHFKELTGSENARFFARAYGASDDAISACLSDFDLAADADTPVGEYSFGMQRKLLLSEALAHEPALLLIDEPTIGLDASAGTTLIDALRARARSGVTVVGTNDLGLAMHATRVVFLHHGRKVADAPPAELLKSIPPVRETDLSDAFHHLTGHPLYVSA